MESSHLPTPTVYIKNLNTKLKKGFLKSSLYALFSQYGQIIDLVALKTEKMRGQAFVVYKDIVSASTAIRSLNGFNFFGKELNLDYSRHKSKATLEFESMFDPSGQEIMHKDVLEEEKEIEKTSEPNKILFVENLPNDASEGMLTVLFQSHIGFKQVRAISGRKDIAFVEFDDVTHAAMAKTVLNNFRIDDSHLIAISFAKK